MHYLYCKIIYENNGNIIKLISASFYNPLYDVMKRVVPYYCILYHIIYYQCILFTHIIYAILYVLYYILCIIAYKI